MSISNMPWIEISRGSFPGPISLNTPLNSQPEFCYAIFAAQIFPKPFEERLKWKWGFNAAVLLEEAIDRQRLFIESQHPANILTQSEPSNCQTLALRCLRNPDHSNLDLLLLGKVWARDAEAARVSASYFWNELQALFPYDFTIQPIASQADFFQLSGQQLVNEVLASKPGAHRSLAEVRRFESLLADGTTTAFVFGKWQPSSLGNEQVWRALVTCPIPIMLNITLRPTILLDEELLALADMKQTIAGFAQSKLVMLNRDVEWATKVYQDRLVDLRYPFLLQVHLIALGDIPDYVLRAVGSAFTHPSGGKSTPPGYQVVQPATPEHIDNYLHDLLQLEPIQLNNNLSDPRFIRLRFMADPLETSALFRFPFPPCNGIPGVSFVPEQIQSSDVSHIELPIPPNSQTEISQFS